METIKFDLNKNAGKFKAMNATNGGPWHKRHANDQWRSNFEAYKAARIPYSRNHDSNLCGSTYGGPYAHDISVIFPDFDADVNNPASYDFACTDESILTTLEAGTQTFFRLGQCIEHQIKKHHSLPPADFVNMPFIWEDYITKKSGRNEKSLRSGFLCINRVGKKAGAFKFSLKDGKLCAFVQKTYRKD